MKTHVCRSTSGVDNLNCWNFEAGKLTPIIDSVYPLSDFREAFRHMIEDELLGKVIVTP